MPTSGLQAWGGGVRRPRHRKEVAPAKWEQVWSDVEEWVLGSRVRAAGSDPTRKEQVAAVLDRGFSRGVPGTALSPSQLSAHEAVSPQLGLCAPGRGRVQFLWVLSPGWPD